MAQQFRGDPESGQISVRDYAWVVGDTWQLTSNMVNQATVGVSRSGLLFPRPFAPAFPNVFTFTTTTILAQPFADISFQSRFVPTPTIRDDITWNKGNHTVAFGVSIKPIRSKSTLINDFNFVTVGLGGNTTSLHASLRPANIRAGTTASTNWDNAFPFLLGRYAQVGTNFNYSTSGTAFPPGTGKTRDFRYNEYEAYVQDNWRIRAQSDTHLWRAIPVLQSAV